MNDCNLENELGLISNSSDVFLSTLINVVNQLKLEFSITISSGGLIISGLLISGDEYFSLLGQEIAESPNINKEVAESLKKVMKMHGDIYVELRERNKQEYSGDIIEDTQSEEKPRLSFYHLKNTRFFSPSGESMNNLSRHRIWRGNIDHIDGYTLGALEPRS